MRPRWKRGVDLVEGMVGEALGQEYVAAHFPPENKARMVELVDNLLAAFEESIDGLDWMTDADQARGPRQARSSFTRQDRLPGRLEGLLRHAAWCPGS